MKTTIQNGAQFDCRSFEHWHRDCPYTFEAKNSSFSKFSMDYKNSTNLNKDVNEADESLLTSSRRCASFNMFDESEDFKQEKRERYTKKLGYCVLSNQTMKTAGRSFGPNNKVTYYELLCKSEF